MAMARQFPREVLFVPAPSVQDLTELEAKTGPLWKASRAEQVLLQLTDVTQTVRDRVERLMKEHYYDKWNPNQQQQVPARGNDSLNSSNSSGNDKDDKDRINSTAHARNRPAAPTSSSSLSASIPPRFSSGGYSNSQQEESLSAFEHDYYNNDDELSADRRPGQSLIGADLVHPNDKGYEFWGRHIGLAIAREWQVQDEQQQTSKRTNGN
jgi:lysophospholipase L1-like esterase